MALVDGRTCSQYWHGQHVEIENDMKQLSIHTELPSGFRRPAELGGGCEMNLPCTENVVCEKL